MRKALVTFGVGPLHSAMREATLPAMAAYARRHGYELVADRLPTLDPPAWGKIPLLLETLETHDAVLWLDADVLILDQTEDIADRVYSPVGLVVHTTGEGRVPNTGVWYLTRDALPLLREALALYPTYRNHKWWEQGAVIDRLEHGWAPKATQLYPGWNRHRHDTQSAVHVRFLHFTAVPDRANRCRQVAEMVYGATPAWTA